MLDIVRAAERWRDSGLVFDGDNLKVEEYLERWLFDSVQDTVRPTTYERYEQIVRTHIRPVLGGMKLKNVTPAHVRGLYREKLEEGLSPRTVQYIHVTLHKALKQAVADGFIPRNATEAVKPPQVRREEIHPLTAEQTRYCSRRRGVSAWRRCTCSPYTRDSDRASYWDSSGRTWTLNRGSSRYVARSPRLTRIIHESIGHTFYE